MKNIIVTQNVTLGYPNHLLASKINLTIQQGEFIGIFGANGSGKTSFLKTILGLIKPLSGNVLIFNAKPKHGNHQIGYMPQLRNHEGFSHLTSRTMIEAAFKSSCYGLPLLSRNQKKAIQEILNLVEANAYVDRPFYQLSGGEQKRIYLAQILLEYPPLLLLDEPLAGLDPRFQEAFIQLLCHIQEQLNLTILFTAHDPNPLLNVMDRVLYFAQGKVALGSIDEVITSAKLSELYDTPIEVLRVKDRLIVIGEERGVFGHHD